MIGDVPSFVVKLKTVAHSLWTLSSLFTITKHVLLLLLLLLHYHFYCLLDLLILVVIIIIHFI